MIGACHSLKDLGEYGFNYTSLSDLGKDLDSIGLGPGLFAPRDLCGFKLIMEAIETYRMEYGLPVHDRQTREYLSKRK